MRYEHSLECPTCDKESPQIGEMHDEQETEIFYCFSCQMFFGILMNGEIYTWTGDRGVEEQPLKRVE